jgi:hypothetical protein
MLWPWAQVAAMGLVRAGQHVVCVQQVHEEFCLKIMAVETAPVSSKSNLASDVSGTAAHMCIASVSCQPLCVVWGKCEGSICNT